MATMVDVARIAGVSISTVSHVLNGTRHVEPETRDRVLKAIEQTSYRQDALARAMRRSQTDSIGLVLSDVGEPAFAEMMHGVQESAYADGMTLLVANSDETAERELRAVRTLLERRVDGVVLARVADSSDEVMDELTKAGVPVVLMDRLAGLRVDQVGTENRSSMRELVDHLVGHGHRRIVAVVGDTRVSPLRERLEGFNDAVRSIGLAEEDQAVLLSSSKTEDLSDRLAAVLREHRPTALIACSTHLAAGALTVVRRLGMAIPSDLAFATFDGFPYPELFEPHITTVRQPGFEVGAAAVRLLISRIGGSAGDPSTVRLSPTIEFRESTGPHVPQPSEKAPATHTTRFSRP
jgi:LacI family transcriptional regulator